MVQKRSGLPGFVGDRLKLSIRFYQRREPKELSSLVEVQHTVVLSSVASSRKTIGFQGYKGRDEMKSFLSHYKGNAIHL
jgi:hypothetical protein